MASAKPTKKETVKKETVKTTSKGKLATKSSADKEKEFMIKQVGQNVILVKGETKYSRKFETPEERQEIKDLAAKYNAKPTQKLEKEIISKMNVDKKARTTEVKEKVAKAKATKQEKPLEEKLKSKEEQIEEARKLLQDEGYTVRAKPAPSTYSGRREH